MDNERQGPSTARAAENNNGRNMLEGVDSIQTYQSDDDAIRERKESINSNQSIKSYDSSGKVLLVYHLLCQTTLKV